MPITDTLLLMESALQPVVPNELSEQNKEVTAAQSIFSKRLLPGEEHADAAGHHMAESDMHRDMAEQLRKKYRSTRNSKARKSMLAEITYHHNAHVKHTQVGNYHIRQHNKENPTDQMAEESHERTKPSIFRKVGKAFMNAWHSKLNPAERYSHVETHPRSPIAIAHNTGSPMPHTDPKDVPQYQQDQADFHKNTAKTTAASAATTEDPAIKTKLEELQAKHENLAATHQALVDKTTKDAAAAEAAKNKRNAAKRNKRAMINDQSQEDQHVKTAIKKNAATPKAVKTPTANPPGWDKNVYNKPAGSVSKWAQPAANKTPKIVPPKSIKPSAKLTTPAVAPTVKPKVVKPKPNLPTAII